MQKEDVGTTSKASTTSKVDIVNKADPCPFCGSAEMTFAVASVVFTWYCRCTSCGASGPVGSIDPEGAYEKWNERYASTSKEQDHDRPTK